jgi:hypothetical protein
VKTWAELYKFGLQTMPARIRGLNVLALLVGTSKVVPLQMVLGLTLEGCAGSHRDHWLPTILAARGGPGVATGVAGMTEKIQAGYHPYLSVKKGQPRSATQVCSVNSRFSARHAEPTR